MEEHSVFDRLANRLSKGERKELFDKISSVPQQIISQEPLKIIEETEKRFDYERAYRHLLWWEKLWIFFKSVFGKINREALVEDLILRKLGKKIERSYSDIYWHNTGILGQNFYWNVKRLQEKVDFLRDPLRKVLASKKKDFFAFLAGWDMPDIQEQLLSEIQPEHVAYEKSIHDPYKVRKEIEYRIEDILSGIDKPRKQLIYARVRLLHHLSRLCSFQYDKMLISFEKRPSQKMEALLSEVRPQLVDLTHILYTIKSPPPEELMKLVFMFYLQDVMTEDDEKEYDRRFSELLRRTEECMTFIRNFNITIPLLDLARLVMRNIEYTPPAAPGGEDWFVLYKQFWYERFEEAMRKYSEEYKREMTIDRAKEFLKAGSYPELPIYGAAVKKYRSKYSYIKTISFIRGFMDRLFIPEMNSPLKLILIDGEFYKEQNREEYNESYNGLLWANDRITEIEQKLEKDGEYGLRIELIEHEIPDEKKKHLKIQAVLNETDVQIREVIDKTIENSLLIKNLIGGILYGDMGGRYDTLSNMGYIGRNENRNLQQKLGAMQKKIDTFVEILSELYASEKREEG